MKPGVMAVVIATEKLNQQFKLFIKNDRTFPTHKNDTQLKEDNPETEITEQYMQF